MMDVNLLREAVTVLSFGAFLGIVAFAVHPGNRKRFDEAAMAPLLEDEALSPTLSLREREQTWDAVSQEDRQGR